MIQKPWCIVVYETIPVGPGGASRARKTGARIFPDEESATTWLSERRANPLPGVRFKVTNLVYGDPVPYSGDPTAFEFAPDAVTISEDLLCPTYFPS